ncbi:MAG: sensor histidine kinase [Candidatus Rokuibacteriota bacterium]
MHGTPRDGIARLVGAAGCLRSRRRELLLAAAFLGMGAWEILELWLAGPAGTRPWRLGVLLHSAQVVLVLAATYLVLRLWQEKSAREGELIRLVEAAAFARDEERRRVGYDLHDGIAPLVVSAKQHLDTCRDALAGEPQRAREELERATDALGAAITETRRVLMALHPAALESTGLADAVRTAVEAAARQTGWQVRVRESIGGSRLPPAVEVAAYRIFQEAIENARRHARCRRLSVELGGDDRWLDLRVEDDGVGFVVPEERASNGGLGLSSMRERARLVGGRCTVASEPGRGTRVGVRLPRRAADVRVAVG